MLSNFLIYHPDFRHAAVGHRIRDTWRVNAQKAGWQGMTYVAALRGPRAGAVEMPPYGNTEENSKHELSTLTHRAWKSVQGPQGHHVTYAPAAGQIYKKEDREKMKRKPNSS